MNVCYESIAIVRLSVQIHRGVSIVNALKDTLARELVNQAVFVPKAFMAMEYVKEVAFVANN